MGILSTVIGIGLGIALGVAISAMIIVRDIKNSNDLGDNTASYSDFSPDFSPKIIDSADKVPRDLYMHAILKARTAYYEKMKQEENSQKEKGQEAP